ncbi:phage tail assembly chaperone [Pseudomonas fluorescens]|uniref:phage tail assembly chaperone n=1 Tax=Pseudomonas fluorescens TaxID=294 RepID=UPI00374A2151
MTDIILFSPSTCGAYLPSVHEFDIPEDVVPVSRLDWEALLNELATAPKKIGVGPEGQPVLVEPPPFDSETLQIIELEWRNAQLASTDTLVTRHRDELEGSGLTTLTAVQYADLQTYRQQLRQWPQRNEFPSIQYRPSVPEWLIEKTH